VPRRCMLERGGLDESYRGFGFGQEEREDQVGDEQTAADSCNCCMCAGGGGGCVAGPWGGQRSAAGDSAKVAEGRCREI